MSETQPEAEAKPQPPLPKRWRRAFIGIGLTLLVLLALPIGAWFLLPRLELGHMAAERASLRLGRQVTIEQLRIIPGERLRVELRGLSLANLEGGSRAGMVTLESLTASLDPWELLRGSIFLRQARIEGLSVLLERNAARQANWHFGPERPGGAGGDAPPARDVPRFEDIAIARSEIIFRTSNGLILPTKLETASLTSAGSDEPVMLRVQGSYNAVPVTMEGPLGSIADFRNAANPFSLDLTATARDTVVTLLGSATDPLNFEGVQGQLELRAPNPRTLLALAGSATDGVPELPVQISGTMDHQGDLWRLTSIRGELDGAPLTGDLLQFREGARGQPDALAVDLAFTRLDLNRILLAGGHGEGDDADMPLAVFTAPDPLLDLRLAAGELKYGAMQAREARLVASMVPGEIRVETLAMRAFGARISATGLLEADDQEVKISADVGLQEGELEALRRAFGIRELPLSGRIEGRLAVEGRGRTLNAASRRAHVSAVLVMSGGNIAREVVEMASTDVRTLFRRARGRTRLSCAIGVLDMRAGVGEIAPLRLRSANGTIHGIVSFDLTRQHLDLVIGTQSATTAATALDIPVRVSGSFSDPAVLPAQWSRSGRARLAAGDHVAPLPPALRDYARRSPCYFAGGG